MALGQWRRVAETPCKIPVLSLPDSDDLFFEILCKPVTVATKMHNTFVKERDFHEESPNGGYLNGQTHIRIATVHFE